jgi:beta-galactosidase
VRLAEFAWSKLEPESGVFDFDWLDRAMATLSGHDIGIILGTPTASPPAWLMAKHPEAFIVDTSGQRRTYGNRREYCPTNRDYLEYSRRIVRQMTEHFANHLGVVAWQIDNEFGDRCYCPVCASAFQVWLRDRYGSLDALNGAWGTIFWGHTYSKWEQIPVPSKSGGPPNPGLAIDYRRFCSDAYVSYQKMQIDIVREACPNILITHNMMGFPYDKIDYFDLARDLDVVSWDNYQRNQFVGMQAAADAELSALSSDAMRGLKKKNVWVMEQQSGSGGWDLVGVTPRPGEIRLWAYQAIAHGADAIIFFRWRTAPWGTEEYWHGVLDHHGIPGRRYDEVRKMGQEIARVGESILESEPRPETAILSSYDARFAFQIQGNSPRFSYAKYVNDWYRAFHKRNVPMDIVSPDLGFEGYRLLIAPALHVLTQDVADRLERFVSDGGVLVITARSGVKNEANAVVEQPLPGLLSRMCGVEVAEYDSLAPDMDNAVEFVEEPMSQGGLVPVDVWCDILRLAGATVVARYSEDYYAGAPAITINAFGNGHVVYVGAIGKGSLPASLSDWLIRLAGVTQLIDTPEGVEITARWRGDRRILFLLNHTSVTQDVALAGSHDDLISGATWSEGILSIPARDVRILADSEI